MDFETSLRAIVERTGWTQRQLGARLGVSSTFVNRVLNGRTKALNRTATIALRIVALQDELAQSGPLNADTSAGQKSTDISCLSSQTLSRSST
jgi:transcriptional regulator with XRE-family HTH domain